MPAQTLPGVMVHFSSACSTGSHTNQFGVGELSICMHRAGAWPWLDLGNIYFASPTPAQYETAVAARSSLTEESRAYSDIHRRLSRKQAEYVHGLIVKMLNTTLDGVVPSDDEIEALLASQQKG